jgi:protoporphyrinogen oxidase
MARVAVIGAGVMGLAAAYEAVLQGHDVDVYEATPEPGGMAAHFMLGDCSIERFYHFVCKTDTPTRDLLDELGLAEKLNWVPTGMGYFIGGRLHEWGNPIGLLRFPHLTLVQKFRYGLLMLVSARRDRWDSLEHRNARRWITAWCGETVYRVMWAKLFAYKFYGYADNISAAWIWTRIKRIGRSRRSLMQEELGFIEGGSETLVLALVAAIEAKGGRVHVSAPAERISTENGQVRGLRVAGRDRPADAVIATVPTPLVPALAPDLPEAVLDAYRAIPNIGIVCVVLRLRRQVTPYFWLNIDDPDFEIPGIVEFSNLRPVGDTVVYVPYYMPVSEAKWSWPHDKFIANALACVCRINQAITQADLVAAHVGRLRHAQPVCAPGFAARLPPVQTAIAGLQIADTCFYYPEDRGIAESIRLGRAMARAV